MVIASLPAFTETDASSISVACAEYVVSADLGLPSLLPTSTPKGVGCRPLFLGRERGGEAGGVGPKPEESPFQGGGR